MKTRIFSLFIFICSTVMFSHASLAQDARPMVRLIYFVPKDRTPQPDIDTKLDTLIKNVQTFYANQMAAHGFGRKTFRFEVDARGKAIVHRVNGKFTDRYYHEETAHKARAEIGERFDLSQTVHFISIDIGNELIDTHSCGVGGIEGTVLGGHSVIPASGSCFVGGFGVDVAAHELGHAFGLQHDFRNDTYLMSYGSERDQLSACAAHWLNVHPVFNPGGTFLNQDTTLEILTPNRPPNPNAIAFRFEIADPDGIHQVQLLTPTVDTTHTAAVGSPELLDYRQLNGSQSNTVEFVVTGLTSANASVSLQIIDRDGNITLSKPYSLSISILEMPPKAVSIPDPHLAAAVREQIGASITTHTMLSLRRIICDPQISDLTGLEHAHNLGYLYTKGNPISDVSPLAGLTQLTELNIRGTEVSDISPLAGLTQLTELSLSSSVSDITPLAGLTQLKRLYLIGVPISDISPLAGLTQLERLDLQETKVSDITPLAGLTQLKRLWLIRTRVSDLTPLAGLTQLKYLWLWITPILDISPLASLTQLIYLGLDTTEVSDISPLAGLTQLTELGLSRTAVSDLTPLAEMTRMKSLTFYNTAVSDLTPLAEMTQLKYLWASDTEVSDVSPLAGLTQLKHLVLGGNGAISDISPLGGLTQLTYLSLSSTAISDVSVLAEMTQLIDLSLFGTAISDVSVLAGMTQLKQLHLSDTAVSDISPLTGLTKLTFLSVSGNSLSYVAINTHVPAIQAKGTQVVFTPRTPRTLETIAGTAQSGLPNTTLPLPFIVEVRDAQNRVFSEVPATFAITLGDGKLSVTTTKTDADGKAQTYLTLGKTAGTITVQVSVPEIKQPIHFTAEVVRPGTQIVIRDPELRTRIAKTLGKPSDGTITVADMSQLTELTANNANIRELTGLQHAAHLTTLSLDNNAITDMAPLAGLTQLQTLSLNGNRLVDVAPLTGLTQLKTLDVRGNLLSYPTLYTDIPTLQASGATVTFDQRIPTTLVKLSGTQSLVDAHLPILIEVQDEQGFGFAGVPVTFSVTSGGGRLSVSDVVTDEIGRAETLFTLGASPGEQTLRVATAEPVQPVRFSITAVDPNAPVSVPDAHLRSKIAEGLGKPRDVELTVGDMARLSRLNALNANIQDLTGLEHARSLKDLFLNGNPISDITPLAGLAQLQDLLLYDTTISDVVPLADLTKLTRLILGNTAISDVSPLSRLTHLEILSLSNAPVSDISALAGLTQLKRLQLQSTEVSDVLPLAELTQLKWLDLRGTEVSDISPLVGLTQLTELFLTGNPLNYASLHTHIPAMQAKGIQVYFDQRTYPALDIISGAGQQASGGESLAHPLVVAAIDANGTPMPGVPVTFTVTQGNGELSTTTATTDANGRAETTFTLGSDPGTHSVRASGTGGSPVTFIAVATAARHGSPGMSTAMVW